MSALLTTKIEAISHKIDTHRKWNTLRDVAWFVQYACNCGKNIVGALFSIICCDFDALFNIICYSITKKNLMP